MMRLPRLPYAYRTLLLLSSPRIEVFQRRQRILRLALEKLSALRLTELDEYFWTSLRESMLEAGADAGDLEALVAFSVLRFVGWTNPDAPERQEQLELIAEHLACADITIRIVPGDVFVSVDGPRVH